MANVKERGTGVFGDLAKNPATGRLADEAKNLLSASGGRIVSKVGDRLTSTTGKLDKIAEDGGSLGTLTEGAKRMVGGDSPVKAAMGGVMSRIKDKAKGLFGKGRGGGGRAKFMNIQESVDVGVPVSTAYDQWTQFQDFSRFMKGVESVEQTSETETNWRAKVFKSRRTWKATITEQIPDRRISWTSEGAKGSTKGVVTFHPLADDLTRVLVSIEYYPQGFMEKTGNLWRAPGRRTRLDIKNYRRFIMSEGEATGSWRGEIRDGEVVRQPDEEADQDESESRTPDDERRQESAQHRGSGESSDEAEGQEDESDDEQLDESDDEQADESDDEQADESDEEQLDESDEEQADESDEEQADESDEEQADESDDEQADESDDEQADESDDEQLDESDDEQMDESDDEQLDESDDEQLDESDDEQMDESDEFSEEDEEGEEGADDEDGAGPSDRSRRRDSGRQGSQPRKERSSGRSGRSRPDKQSSGRTRQRAASR